MSEKTDSQIIHEARGLCWHERIGSNKCSCGWYYPHESIALHIIASNPSVILDGGDYFEAMGWTMSQDFWPEALKFFWSKLPRNGIWDKQAIPLFMFDKEKGSHALAEYIKYKKEIKP